MVLLRSWIGLWGSGGLPDEIFYAEIPGEHNWDASWNIIGRMKGLGKSFFGGYFLYGRDGWLTPPGFEEIRG